METKLKFQTTKLATFDIIEKPGVYTLEVLTPVTEKNLVKNENGRESYIVSFKAISQDKLGQVTKTFEGKEEVDIEETSGLFLTGNIWKNEGEEAPALPMKGQKVQANVIETLSRDGELVLRVSEIKVPSAIKAQKFNILTMLGSAVKEEETLVHKN